MINSKMDNLCFSLCFVAIIASSLGLDPVVVKFENASRVDTLDGAKLISIKCHVNRPPMQVINNNIDIIHINPVTKKETTLSTAADLVDGEPSFYDVKMDAGPGNGVILEFTIKTVRVKDDGTFKCHFHGDEEGFAEKEIVVHRPFTSLKMRFGDFEPVEDSPQDPLTIDHGEYEVSCVAEGSNPATENIKLTFHGVELNDSKTYTMAMKGNERKFKTEVNGTVNILISNSGQDLVCGAVDSTGQNKMVKLTVEVNIYDPVVTCNDTEAHLGQDNPVLYCTVNHTEVEVSGYAFQVGDSEETFEAGKENPNNVQVNVSDVSEDVSIVSLDLHKAEHQYLDKNYYLLTHLKGGHTHKAKVRLSKKEAPVSGNGNGNGGNTNMGDGNGNAGVRFSPSTLLYVLMLVATFWSSH